MQASKSYLNPDSILQEKYQFWIGRLLDCISLNKVMTQHVGPLKNTNETK